MTVWVSDTWSSFADLSHARADNARLSRALLQVRRERDRLVGLADENEELARLLVIKAANPAVTQRTARVVGAGTSPAARTFEIDRGALDGLRTGAVAVAAQGLVGVVGRVAWTSSEVIALTDPRLSVHVRAVRTGARGRIRGRGGGPTGPLELTELVRSDDVQVGDRLESNGLGRVFFAGVPVGVVRQVLPPEGVLPRRAEVEPFVDFARLERMNIVIGGSLDTVLATPEPLLPIALRTSTAAPAAEDARPGEPLP